MSRQEVFHSFLLDDSKTFTSTTAAHSKRNIKLLQNIKVLKKNKSTIWENIYECAEQYRYTTKLYLLSMLSHEYNILIGRGVGAPGNREDVVYGLNATKKRFPSILITTVQSTSAATNDSQMVMYTSISNKYISIAREFQKHLSNPTRAHGLIDHGKYSKLDGKRKWMEREYHVQDRKDVQQKLVKISCASTQFQELIFFCPHAKPHGVRVLSKHYHLLIEPKLGHIKCSTMIIAM